MFRFSDKNSGYLFNSDNLSSMLEERKGALRFEVEHLDGDRLLNTSPTDLSAYLVEKYKLSVPTLASKEKWIADEQETTREVLDYGRLVYVPGQSIQVEIPFEGDPDLFFGRASTYSNPPRADIKGQSLFISFVVSNDEQGELTGAITHAVSEIEKALGWVRHDVESFNNDLEPFARKAIDQRRERLLKNKGRLAGLGIPIRHRPGAPTTYVAPEVRRRIVPTLPTASMTPYEPEPVLDLEIYEHILKVVQNMTHVIERSPSAFSHMDEEAIRQHYLVQLNGQFEGAATGETFNLAGKTDILLRYKDRNLFIAECKFWKGPKAYNEAIDQLFKYTAWRDTKTAIFLFNKGTAMSTVLAGVKEHTENHPNYKRTEPWKHESGFRFTMRQPSDANRELLLTVLVFDVP